MMKKLTYNLLLLPFLTGNKQSVANPRGSNSYTVKNTKNLNRLMGLFVLVFGLFTNGLNAQVDTSAPGSGTTTVPANAVSATVQIWGAGGAGGGSTSNNNSGAGGGGGSYSTRTFTVSPGQTIDYSVGGGGNGTTNSGTNGVSSTLDHANSSTNMVANGGTGGGRNGGATGQGGTASGGTTNTSGQNGTNGGSGTGGNGGDAGNAPGTGGVGRNDADGDNGVVPGGGGGGGERRSCFYCYHSGGNGANGQVIITYEIVLTPTITAYTPDPVCIGQPVTITGTNFTGVSEVQFNGIDATSFTVNSETQITAVVPTATSGPITVETSGGIATSGNITINSLSAAPTGISGTDLICLGDTTTLTRVGGSAGTGANLEWFSGTCGGTPITGTNSITVSPTTTTTYFVRYAGDCNTTTCAQITVTVDNPVATAGAISGDITVCQGDTGVVYTVPVLPNASSYTWSLPQGATIVSGANTNSITVDYNASASSGNVSVFGSNSCGDGTASNLTITVSNLPEAPGTITGTASVCPGDTNVSFLIPAINYATGYTWTLPSGATISSGAGTESITVDFSLAAASGNISVYGTNACGNGTLEDFAVTVEPLPSAAGIISGPATVCPGDTGIVFSVPNIANATDYTWTLPIGATITNGDNTDTITVDFSNSAASGIITVQGTNACGVGTVSTNFNLTINTESLAPTGILGTTTICETASTTLTVDGGFAGTGATAEWFSGTCGGTAEGTGNSIIVSPITTTTYFVHYNGTCNTTTCAQVTVNVNPLPLAAGTITGPSDVCQGNTGITFTVPTILNATDYIWTLPSGATIASGTNTNTIVVNFDITATSGIITVQGSNTCGVGAVSANFPITVNITPYIPTNYTIAACSGILTTLTPVNGGGNIIPAGTTYSWGLPTVTGSITGATALTGQTNFNQTLINPTNVAHTATYSVTAETAGCSASTFTVIVTVNPKPIGAGTPAAQTVCNGTNNTDILFSETTGIAGTINYSWTRDNTANLGGLATSGFGTSIHGTLINNTTDPQTTIFTVIASSQYGCASEPFTVSVTVSPSPTVAASPLTQIVCSEENITPIALSTPVMIAGALVYSWTRTNTTNITGLENGTTATNSIIGAMTNTTNLAQTTVFTITSVVNGCPSPPVTVSVTVNPKPTVAVNLTTQTVCGGSPIANIVATNPNTLSGVTYSWTRDNTTNLTGIGNSGTGNTISGTFVNNSAVDQIAIFTIRANRGSCYSETTSEVIVNPTPLVVATPVIQQVCYAEPITPINLSNIYNILGTTYSWTRNNTTNVTGMAASGTGTSISGTLTNTRPTTQTVIFTIIATAPNGCSQTTTATVTLNAELRAPVIGNSQDVCYGQTPSTLFMTTSVSGGSNSYTYQWERDSGTGWGNAPGTSTNATYNPNNDGFYRLIVTDVNCGTVVYSSNVVAINYIGLGGIFDTISAFNLPGPVCSGTSINPGVTIDHTILSDVDFTWTGNSTYITPANGTIPGTRQSFFIFRRTTGYIPITVQNNTNATVVTQLYVAPIFDNFTGTCTADAIAIPITIRPVPVAEASIVDATFCAGTSAGIEVTGNITDAPMQFSWIRSTATGVSGPANSGGFSTDVAPGGTYTINNTLTNTSGAPQNITYTITPRSNDCNGAPITIEVTVAPNVTPGTIAASQTICYGNDPVAFTQVTAATGMNLTYQWQISITSATAGFTDIVGATGITYDAPGPVTQDTWYRRVTVSEVNNIVCNSLPSNVLMVTINNLTAGTVGDDQTVCSPGDPGNIANVAHAIGLGARTYQWQLNTVGCGVDDSDWTNIPGATGAAYNPPAGLLVTTYYRRIATFASGGCSIASDCVTVYVNDVTGGTIGTDQTICGDNPDEFTVVTASTGSGTLSYQWQSRPGTSGAWNDIPGATSATYDAPPGLAVTTSYRRMTFSTLNGVSCSALSNIVIVTANAVTPGVIAGNRTVCSGGNPAAFTVTTAATGSGLTYQWQSAPAAAGPYTDIPGATSATYDVPVGITVTTFYQRVVTATINGIECPVTSNFLTVFVNDVIASTVAGDQTICSTENPDAFTVLTTATGSGTLSYQWQSSTTSASGPWTNINLETGATYDPPILTQTTYYQVVVTSTLNGVACTDSSNPITVTVSPYEIATAGPDQTTANCTVTTVTLAGSNVSNGQWTATPNTGYFSLNTAYNATFTGESGTTYTLTWTAFNDVICGNTTDTVIITIPPCGNNLVFDGTDDNISFDNNYPLNTGAFSVEAWIKPINLSGTQTIISKRNSASLTSGYDLSLIGNSLHFRWNNQQMNTTQLLTNSRWYHVAVTFNGTNTYTLYIDGFALQTNTSGAPPSTNINKALIGAMDTTGNAPINYFGGGINGGIDEVRIWNTELSETQIREMMNQEIEANGANVSGVAVPRNIDGGLQWNNLIGYYQMRVGPQTSIINGNIQDISTTPIQGKLNSMSADQLETAPIPYVSSITGGTWDNQATWLNGGVQQIPNSTLNSIVSGQAQTWNIVRTASNVTSGNRATTLLGLLVDSNRFTIDNDQLLRVNNYLLIDGVLDLEGESQLLQNETAVIDYVNSTGYMERDQQGTANTFSYNYWGSPVSTAGVSSARTYTLDGILYNGSTKALWTNGVSGLATPLTISSRWIYSFSEGDEDDYSDWVHKGRFGAFEVGLGFTMKGPGPGASTGTQNYTFRGMPNNGSIAANISANGGFNNQTLIGNPYASAIDADEFIRDNIPPSVDTPNPGTTGSIDGTLYFWKQASSNNSHITAEYQGGYATYNLSGGVAAVAPSGIGNVGDAISAIPQRYIAVGQGFFVTSADIGSQISTHLTFKNSQRAFVTESLSTSIFFRTEAVDLIKRVRLNFTTPEGANRPLLLAFTPNNEATEGFDYGYDAKNSDDNPSDMSFIIENKKYVIQGVGEFNVDNMYPVTLDLGVSGNIQIELAELENFNEDIDVYVYDALLGTYSRINTVNYQIALNAGSHANRYFITFKEDATLDVVDDQFSNVVVNYLSATNEIYILVPTSIDIKQVYLVNMLGQTVKSWNKTNAPLSHESRLAVKNISEGTYVIKVRTSDNALINKKVVVKQD